MSNNETILYESPDHQVIFSINNDENNEETNSSEGIDICQIGSILIDTSILHSCYIHTIGDKIIITGGLPYLTVGKTNFLRLSKRLRRNQNHPQ